MGGSLDEYRRKRDFGRSPEPEGRVGPRGDRPRSFCVQKHLASHLHYDLRLEHAGVLLSWAVPKGPSLDPSVRRLAMQVEAHPLDYGAFEGVIPEGYGAGIVLLWDRGLWIPDEEDVEAGLRRGHLRFELRGVKLKGRWSLVRRGEDDRAWWLIKHRDEWAGEIDIAAFAPLSVESGHDMAEILADEETALWQSHRRARGGAAGRMLSEIVERAAALRAEREDAEKPQGSGRRKRA